MNPAITHEQTPLRWQVGHARLAAQGRGSKSASADLDDPKDPSHWRCADDVSRRPRGALQALTLDLDDTLWPVWPTILRAEALLMQWLCVQAPATAAANDAHTLRELREAVARQRPEWAHDFSAIRRESRRRALAASGDDPNLAEPAFEVFLVERQRVQLFDDVLPALDRLAARWPIVALSNGNADIHRIGIGRYFVASLSAREFGMGKPAAPIFHAACARLVAVPAAVLHIGDDGALDVDGALAAGMRAAWVQRSEVPGPDLPTAWPSAAPPKGVPHHHVSNLTELADELGA